MILIVDDDRRVIETLEIMLKGEGYPVEAAANGAAAYDRLRSAEYTCMLLDMNMPQMRGEDTFQGLKKIRKDAKVLLCSGLDEQTIVTRFPGKGLAGFLQKPFEIGTLVHLVQKVLEPGAKVSGEGL